MTRDTDLVCFSHLRWDFVYQRPQHLMSRFARHRRVFFVEDPVYGTGRSFLDVSEREEGVHVVTPYLPEEPPQEELEAVLSRVLASLLEQQEIRRYILWYYNPLAVGWSQSLQPVCSVYDCMDELSAFKNAPRLLRERERELLREVDLVFTGGESLYEAKRSQHPYVHCFPSSVDIAHFGQARGSQADPADQEAIPRPRIGFFGVVDERMDVPLLAEVADARPGWHLVVVGPLHEKIDAADLPQRPNIHYLGEKKYAELPRYIAGWDVAVLPFARNDSTRFISPTKTPEYLAAGKPVVSTSIRDVVRPYGERGLVRIADSPDDFVAAIEAVLNDEDDARLPEVDRFLRGMSWDRTWRRMNDLIEAVIADGLDVPESPVLEAAYV